MDDLNYLFQRQQEERVKTEAAACAQAREAHRLLAFFYEQRISHLTDGRILIAPELGSLSKPS